MTAATAPSTTAAAAPVPATRRRWPLLLAVAGLAVTLRLIHMALLHGSPVDTLIVGDAEAYDTWAMTIVGGDWIGQSVFFQAPLYPYVLAVIYGVFGHSLAAVRLVQIAMDAASCVLLGRCAQQVFDRRVGVVTAVLLALNPVAIFATMLVQKTTLDVLLLSASLMTLSLAVARPVQLRWWVIGGVALGFLSLSRENALLIVVVAAVWPWLALRQHSPRWRAVMSLCLIAGVAAVLAPVAVRNKAVGGSFHLTTSQLGSNLYIGNHDGAEGFYQPLRPGRGSAKFERLDAQQLAEARTGRTLSPGEVSSFWTTEATRFMQDQPLAWLRLMGRKALLLVNAVEIGDTDDQYVHGEFSSLLRALTAALHTGVLLPLACVGVLAAWRRREAWLLLAVAAVYAAAVVIFYVMARYRFPLVVALLPLSAAGLMLIFDAIASRRFRRLILAGGVGGCVAVVMNLPVIAPERSMSVAYFNLGVAADHAGDRDNAHRWYLLSIERHPGYANAHNNLGALLLATGKLDEAAGHLATAVALQPGMPEVHHNTGMLLSRLNRPQEALAEFQKALAIDPRYALALDSIGELLTRTGQAEHGVEYLQRAAAMAPSSAATAVNLGVAYATVHRFEDAAASYRRAITLKPDMAQAHHNLGNALANLHRHDEAAASFRHALTLDPGLWQSRLNLAGLAQQRGDKAQALAHYQALLPYITDNPELQQHVRQQITTLESR